jgi:hypothetical protein
VDRINKPVGAKDEKEILGKYSFKPTPKETPKSMELGGEPQVVEQKEEEKKPVAMPSNKEKYLVSPSIDKS